MTVPASRPEQRVRVHCKELGTPDHFCGWVGYRRDVTRALEKPCPACGGRVEKSFPDREET